MRILLCAAIFIVALFIIVIIFESFFVEEHPVWAICIMIITIVVAGYLVVKLMQDETKDYNSIDRGYIITYMDENIVIAKKNNGNDVKKIEWSNFSEIREDLDPGEAIYVTKLDTSYILHIRKDVYSLTGSYEAIIDDFISYQEKEVIE